jgi:excisionase family DNA binding protein
MPSKTVLPQRRWVSINKTAEHLGVCEKTVRTMIADGRLTGYRNGPHIVRLDLNEVDRAMTSFGKFGQ